VWQVLVRVARALNESGALWCVGGSVLLSQYGLAERPNDLDLLAGLEDAERIAFLLDAMGEALPGGQSATFATRCFRRFTIDGTGVDLMAGLAVNHPEGRYEAPFDGPSIASRPLMDGVPVPFGALEDWYVLYQLMPGREHKARIIEEFLLQNGTQHPDLLARALGGCLPGPVRDRVAKLLGRLN
jgi:hypothetical protein